MPPALAFWAGDKRRSRLVFFAFDNESSAAGTFRISFVATAAPLPDGASFGFYHPCPPCIGLRWRFLFPPAISWTL